MRPRRLHPVWRDKAGPLRSALLERIRAGADSPLPDDEFNRLALAVFEYQYTCNTPYRAYCDRRGATPGSVQHWTEIPAVPTDAFKAAPLVCGDPKEAKAVFRTSGTSAGRGRRGQHYFLELEIYDAALCAGFRHHLLPNSARLRMLSLVRTPRDAPDSSLAHMIHGVMRAFGRRDSLTCLGPEGIDFTRVLDALRAAEANGEAVCLLGTSFSFVHLLDAMRSADQRVTLPQGSRVMDTGGFKGRSREVPRKELYEEMGKMLGIAPEWCVNEYGMTEMSSQLYDTFAGDPAGAEVSGRLHRGPPWVRTRAVDPETLAILPDGTPGVLRHWDLANLHSVLALQTEDMGVCYPEGIRVLGRARGAEARGCSIAMDELLSAIGTR